MRHTKKLCAPSVGHPPRRIMSRPREFRGRIMQYSRNDDKFNKKFIRGSKNKVQNTVRFVGKLRCRNFSCLTWREQQRAIFVNGSILGQTVTVRPPPRDDIMTAGSNAPSGSNPTTTRKRPLGCLPSPAAEETGASRTHAVPRAAARTT
jgi:hypothetical protein